jgi:hypothetical protein
MQLSQIESVAVVHTIIPVEGEKFGVTYYGPATRVHEEAPSIEDFCLNQNGYSLLFTSGERGRTYQEVWIKFWKD